MGSMKELRDACGRVKTNADPNPEARRKRQHGQRSLRHRRLADGSWSMTVRGLPEDQGVLDAALRPGIERRFRHDRRQGCRERHDARAYDELVAMARSGLNRHPDQPDRPSDHQTVSEGGTESQSHNGQPAGPDGRETLWHQLGDTTASADEPNPQPADSDSPLCQARGSHANTSHTGRTVRSPVKRRKGKRRTPNPSYLTLVHVSLEALIRGTTTDDETCEIPGAGAVSVSAARELLGDSILKLVVTNGRDVASVTHLGRGPTAAQKIALLWNQPLCSAAGCCRTIVQSDHRIDWATTRHTRLDELDHLCGHHHNLKTRNGWALVKGAGKRAMVPPTDPHHPSHTNSPEKQAA